MPNKYTDDLLSIDPDNMLMLADSMNILGIQKVFIEWHQSMRYPDESFVRQSTKQTLIAFLATFSDEDLVEMKLIGANK